MPELSLILPVLNEAKFIERVVQDLVRVLDASKIDYQVILVENGSTDNTLDILHTMAQRNPRLTVGVAPHRGWGIAILTAYQLSRGDYLAHMPSDGQIDPQIVPELFAKLRDGTADIVKVRRVTRESGLRAFVSKTYNLLANFLFHTKLADINGCPKVYPASLLQRIHLTSPDSFIDLEMMFYARRLGLRIEEIPTLGLPRIAGKSNTDVWTVLEFLRNMVKFRLENRRAQDS